MADLIEAGLPTVETVLVPPGRPVPAIVDEVVVKPTIDTVPLVLRVDMVRHRDVPTILEVEAIEPSLYLSHEDGSADRLATAIMKRGWQRS